MSSLYDILEWNGNTLYKVNDIVKYNGHFYYAKAQHTSSTIFTDDNAYWDGTAAEFGIFVPLFFWKPSYDSTMTMEPRVKSIKFGDGYEQRVKDGVYNTLLKTTLTFDKKSNAEAKAISHFLHSRAGVYYFLYTPLPPYDKRRRFICRVFDISTTFFDNNKITAAFEEVVA
jgi:phage-related protein